MARLLINLLLTAVQTKSLRAILHSVEFVDDIFPAHRQKKGGHQIHLLFYPLNTFWSGLMKKSLIWGWVILVIPILCRSWWMSLIVIYIFTILMILTHPQRYRWSSIPAVLILCREMNSCTKYLVTIMWGNTRTLSADLLAKICRSQYWNASCTQIGNFTPSWSTYYLCSILHSCLVLPLLLTRKLLVSKVDMQTRI